MGDTIRTRIGAVTGAVLLGALALPAAGQSGAAAVATNLYVNNASTAHCSDSGSGLQEQPYCTVSAAAAAVLPGQTVHIAKGTYPEQVNITRSGTADAPITFTGDLYPGEEVQSAATVGTNSPGGSARALSVIGASHVRISNLNLAATDEGAHVENSTDVTLLNATVMGAGTSTMGVHVTGASDGVTVGRVDFWYISGTSIAVDGGAKNTVLTTNLAKSAIAVTDAPGTVVVSNSVNDGCGNGIVLAGASTGAVLENNSITELNLPGVTPASCQGIPNPAVSVSSGSVQGTRTDYNIIDTTTGQTAYSWAGTAYSDRAAFTAATAQGTHDAFADPTVPQSGDRHARPLPGIDSADENAPGELPTDIYGFAAKDDPLTPNTGTGAGYRDRGAVELQNVGSVYTPVGPTRVLDTRNAIGVPTTTPLGFGQDNLQVTGVNGVPATGVTAVTLNVTVTAPTSSGFLTVYPTETGSLSSNLNWTAGETIANQVTVPVIGGKIAFRQGGGNGTVHVIADLAGYYSASGSVFTAVGPVRALDTRAGIGVPTGTPVPALSTVDLQVTGRNGVPATGVTAVTLNVTVTAPTSSGFLTVYPHGQALPTASSLNWTPGETIPNLVTVPVVDGKVSFFSGGGNGTVHIVADVAGYYSATGHSTFYPYRPERLLDTRASTPDYCGPLNASRPAAVVAPGATLDMDVCTVGLTSLTLNVTVTDTAAEGFLTVYPHGQSLPTASNLNWTPGETIANQVVVPVIDGKVSFHNSSSSSIDLVVDQFGYQGL
ncbi:right-handed parallel beta-helix repeat-containing protein [Kitasatospora mediocidica]|uniref:right-handed parallel beta-helix repeat-containing protein n=1 Tax=Kitasatospora mediocidica TaxID=58352 RepID=UPI00056A2E62|nr:right-handed parallel beta-helix repeat-containing protein [Kitasatospora mediocidica]